LLAGSIDDFMGFTREILMHSIMMPYRLIWAYSVFVPTISLRPGKQAAKSIDASD